MDETYLNQLFGRNKGYVAVASKAGDGKTDWTEQSFLWPNDRVELISWVDARKGSDLFICPALRRGRGRVKGDGAHLSWLWADVDYQDIPQEHWAKIRSRVQKLGMWVVSSGSGDNCHVYVKLDRAVELPVWRRLNAGLRAALMADAKHTDNALLRIPGTRNYKPGGGRVTMAPGRGVVRTPKGLLKLKPWRDVVLTDEGVSDGTWEHVELGLLPGGVKARVSMDVDEAVGRYGTRHGAVFQVTAWLSKRGYTSDQIHTLMSTFPAGLDKERDERGYDLHVDVARCLLAHPTRESIEDEPIILEEAGPDEGKEDPKFRKKVDDWKFQQRALSRGRQELAQEEFQPWPEDASWNAAEAATKERPPVEWAIEGMVLYGQTVSIAGLYKTGKSMLAVNLMRAMCDHTPFLDDRKVRELRDGETVGFWSLEMNEGDLIDHYILPQEIEHMEKLEVLNGRVRGQVSLMTDVGKKHAVNWLISRKCGIWVIDSWARVCQMAGVDENDNGMVMELLGELEQIKIETGVTELYILAHLPRGEKEEGKEHARGASAFDGGVDVRWLFTAPDGDTRFLTVAGGRGVDVMRAQALKFDKETKRMTLGSHNIEGARVASMSRLAEAVVGELPQVSQRTLIQVMRNRGGQGQKNQDVIKEGIQEAIDMGIIRKVPGSGEGLGKAIKYELTPSREPGDTATRKILDMENVSDRPPRKRK